MAAHTFKNGSTVNLFYNDGTEWKTLAHGTSHSLSISNETQEVSSKDFGIHKAQIFSGQSWSISGEYLFTPGNATILTGMSGSAKAYTFCIAVVNEADTYQDGIQPVTSIDTQSKWSVGSVWKKYGDGFITSVEISAPHGEIASCSLEITGSGALLDSAPSTINSYPAA